MYIHHIAIWTNNLELVKEFYLKYFDCTAGENYFNRSKQFSSCFLTFSGGARLELMHRPDIKGNVVTGVPGLTHLAIDAGTRTAVDMLTDRIEKDGFAIYGRPRITGDGYYESVILDPENNIVEIISLQ